MTQAFNLSQLANNINTSGQLDATDGLTGSVPLANGGTGTTNTVNSIVAGTGISTSVSGTQVTINSTVTGGVTSLNGQTGAITNTSFGAIGSYIVGTFLGSTFSEQGRILYDATTAGSNIIISSNSIIGGGTSSVVTNSGSYYTAPVSGTWRCMSSVRPDACSNFKISTLWVRIS
jgi:hypothetical protein